VNSLSRCSSILFQIQNSNPLHLLHLPQTVSVETILLCDASNRVTPEVPSQAALVKVLESLVF